MNNTSLLPKDCALWQKAREAFRPGAFYKQAQLRTLLVTIMIAALSVTTCMAQEVRSPLLLFPNIGIGVPGLDGGRVYHVGMNTSYAIWPFLAAEAQVSFARTRITSSFLSGDTGSASAFNLLAGGRLYLAGEHRRMRPYLNFMLGAMYAKENRSGQSTRASQGWEAGLSTGAFLKINKFVVGVSVDTPSNLILKLGLVF